MARGRFDLVTTLVLALPLGASVLLAAQRAEAATPTFYNNLGAFQADVTDTVLDDYSNPGYVFIQNNAQMSAVVGETDYMSTGFVDLNIVSGGVYCAGCNGSFELAFQTTSVGTPAGVNGVGMLIAFQDPGLPYFAFITFADGTTANVQLPAAGSFWGVAAPERVQRIHFGLSMGGTTMEGGFGIDDLRVGDGNVGGCMVDADCMDTNPCTNQDCMGGVCQFPFNAAPCDDGDACTEDDVCSMGTCGGSPLACDDGDPCTADSCEPGSGCATVPADGPCDDQDPCTGNDACFEGSCGGEPIVCDDENPCTADSCDPARGCVTEPIRGCCTSTADCGADQECDVASSTCVDLPPGESTGSADETAGPSDAGVDDTGGGSGGNATGDSSGGLDTGLASTGAETGSGFDQDAQPDFSVCGCTTTPPPEQRLWWLMVPLGLALRRRRRAA